MPETAANQKASKGTKSEKPRTAVFGTRMGDRVSVSVYRGRVWLHLHQAAGQKLSVGFRARNILGLGPIVEAAAVEAHAQDLAWLAHQPLRKQAPAPQDEDATPAEAYSAIQVRA